MNDRKVNLFVVGAMKAGTTSLIDLISNHPEIYVPPIKEPNFFIDNLPESLYKPSRFFDIENYFKKDFPKPLHITKIESKYQYQKLYSISANEKYLVDSSTAYLHSKESAFLIHKYNPDAKIIILLRDPLKRAFSHYKMDLGKGRTQESFEKSIKKNINAYKNKSLHWFSQLGMSFYKKPVEKYKNLFENVLIFNIESLIEDHEKSLKSLSLFLRINDFKNDNFYHKNISKKPKYPMLFFILSRLGVKDYFSKIFNNSFKQRVFKMTSSNEKFEMKLSKNTRHELEMIFSKESKV